MVQYAVNKKNGRSSYLLPLLFASVSVYADLLLILGLMLELYLAVDESKERVVLTDTYVVTGMDGRASLSDKNVARKNCLAVSLLYAKALGLAVSAVLGRTNTFFMSKKL